MVRAIALLVSAISISRPGIPKDEATRYAKVLNEISSKNDIDPLIAVAMIHYESHWIPSVASEDGEDYGLGQVRARFIGACKGDEDPVNSPSDACKAVKVQLLTGENNLRVMGGIIAANKKMCAEKRGKNKAEYWIAGYQGLSNPERNKYCVPGPTTTRVLDYHKDLLAALLPAPRGAKTVVIAKGGPTKGITPPKGASPTKGAPAKGVVAAKGTVPAKGAVPAKGHGHSRAAVPAKGAVPAKHGVPAKAAPAKAPAKSPAKTAPAKAPAKGGKPPHAAQTPAPVRGR